MINISSQDLLKYQKVSRGGFGIVYQVDNDIAYKIYVPTVLDMNGTEIKNPCLSRPLKKYENIMSRDKLLKHTDLLSDYVFIDGRFGGIKIPFYDGVLVTKLKREKFIVKRRISKQIIRNAKELDKSFIYPTDYKLSNMMFVNGDVKFIDLDDTRTYYLRIPNRLYHNSSVRGIDNTIKKLFHEAQFKPFTRVVHDKLENKPWNKVIKTFDDIEDQLLERSKKINIILVNSSSDLDVVSNFLKNNNYKIVFVYEKKIVDDRYYLDIINKLNNRGLNVFDFICKTDIDLVFSDYNTRECIMSNGKILVKKK